jgi:glucose/arabinose dehydrogenase
MRIRGAAASYRAVPLAATLLVAACGDGGGGETSSHPPPVLTVQRVFPALTFTQPVAMLQAPGDTTRWFVVEQAGIVRVFANTPQVTTSTVFADISGRVTAGGEMGLLGMAFHPDFPTDRRVYLSYTNETGTDRFSRISEFMVDVNGNFLPGSEIVIMRIRQPETNHNGGQIAFGPDGLLYIGIGDGGGANDQHGLTGNGQLLTTLLGKMLRIDISAGAGGRLYSIPVDNPFAANTPCGDVGSGLQNCPEIFAWGFRNPWRWSFDRATTELWVGDVGQGALEEVDRVVLGGNYGWRCFEGTRNTGLNCGAPAATSSPIAEYGRSVGTTVTGGYVYNGTAVPELLGRYVFGDFGSGRIWAIPADTQPTLTMTGSDAVESGLSISSFAEDNDGELYVVNLGGTLHRIIAN